VGRFALRAFSTTLPRRGPAEVRRKAKPEAILTSRRISRLLRASERAEPLL